MDVVLNWVAQGVVVALAAAAALRVMPVSPAQARYTVVWGAYLLVLVLPAVPALAALVVDAPSVDLAPSAADIVVTIPANWWTSPAAALGFWLIWACVHTVRFGLGARWAYEVRRRGRECPADALAQLPHWGQIRGSGRPAKVILSSDVRAAAVLAGGAPTIVLAPALIEQLSAVDLDRVLVHEWAHVQRRDDLAQLAQRVVRIVMGWHPASWWLERQLDFEREAACDEIAVRVTGSAKEYAACLANLAALPRGRNRSVPVLAAAAPSRLRGRIVRILAARRIATARSCRAIAVCAGGGLLACSLAIGNVRVVAAAATSIMAPTQRLQIDNPPGVADAPLTLRPVPAADSAAPASVVHRQMSRALVAPNVPAPQRSARAGKPETIHEEVMPSAPLAASSRTVDPLMPLPDATRSELVLAADAEAPAPQVWPRAADVGIGIGRASRDAGTATARFFGRLGKRIAGSF